MFPSHQPAFIIFQPSAQLCCQISCRAPRKNPNTTSPKSDKSLVTVKIRCIHFPPSIPNVLTQVKKNDQDDRDQLRIMHVYASK